MEVDAIGRLLEEYGESVRAKDVDRFVAIYDDDVRVFDMWGQWAYEGSAAWREMAAEWFASLGSEQVSVEFDEVQKVVGDDVAVADAYVTYKGLSAAGEELRALNNRLTWALRRQPDGKWKVMHEHSSAPVDFETGKVQLQRA